MCVCGWFIERLPVVQAELDYYRLCLAEGKVPTREGLVAAISKVAEHPWSD